MGSLQPFVIELTVMAHSRNMEGWKDVAPEIFKLDTLWATDEGNNSLFN